MVVMLSVSMLNVIMLIAITDNIFEVPVWEIMLPMMKSSSTLGCSNTLMPGLRPKSLIYRSIKGQDILKPRAQCYKTFLSVIYECLSLVSFSSLV
jgi:hypothetical protein